MQKCKSDVDLQTELAEVFSSNTNRLVATGLDLLDDGFGLLLIKCCSGRAGDMVSEMRPGTFWAISSET